jgi:DNA-binding PadR family transcriptional regulator
MRKLEDAGYVVAHKEFQDRRPLIWYDLTAKGKQTLSQWLPDRGGARSIRRAVSAA